MEAQIVKSFKSQTTFTIKHLFNRLRDSKVLSGYLLVGAVIAFYLNGWIGLVQALGNTIVIAVFAVIIRMMTSDKEEPLEIKRPKLEVYTGIVFFIIQFIILLFFWGLIKTTVLAKWMINLFSWNDENLEKFAVIGVPSWLLSYIGNAMVSVVITLIPVLILFLILGYGFKEIGLKPKYMMLTGLLIGISIIWGLPFNIITAGPLHQLLIIYVVHIFINGLQEELFYRGFILPRLERLLKNPLAALVITSIIFNTIHIPQQLYNGDSIIRVILNPFSTVFPSGLLWGYLYLRTRSVVPGILWHTSFGILGIYLISIPM